MFRKILLAIAAAAMIAGFSWNASEALARPWGWGYGPGVGYRAYYGGPRYYGGYGYRRAYRPYYGYGYGYGRPYYRAYYGPYRYW
ncbi:MAG: hypothetical protein ABUL64_03185 [Singulisphaera sp.]